MPLLNSLQRTVPPGMTSLQEWLRSEECIFRRRQLKFNLFSGFVSLQRYAPKTTAFTGGVLPQLLKTRMSHEQSVW